jgi:hypothetical protein
VSLNDKGALAGTYIDGSNGYIYGFLRAANGTVTPFEVSGSTMTYVGCINNKGAITGFSIDGLDEWHL